MIYIQYTFKGICMLKRHINAPRYIIYLDLFTYLYIDTDICTPKMHIDVFTFHVHLFKLVTSHIGKIGYYLIIELIYV